MCNVRAMTPRITFESYEEGVREVDGLEIRWRWPQSLEEPFKLINVGTETTFPATGQPIIPTRFETTIIDRTKGRRYQLSIEVDDSGPAVIGFGMDTAEGFEAIRTAADFKAIPFRQLLDESVAAITRAATLDDDGALVWRTGVVTRGDVAAGRRPRGGRAVTDEERLEQAAEIYLAAKKAGEATSKRVARELQVRPENARRLIMLARKRGLLPPAGSES